MKTLTKMYFDINNKKDCNKLKFVVAYDNDKKEYNFYSDFTFVQYYDNAPGLMAETFFITADNVFLPTWTLKTVSRRLGKKAENTLILQALKLFTLFVQKDTETFLQADKDKILEIAKNAENNYSELKAGAKNV